MVTIQDYCLLLPIHWHTWCSRQVAWLNFSRSYGAQLPHQQLVVLFPRHHGLVGWKSAFCVHHVWRYSRFYQEVQRSLCDYRDGGFLWTTRLHQILFQVRENCHRMLWNGEDSFWGTSYGSFPNISVVFPVSGRQNFNWWQRTLWSTSVQFDARNDWDSAPNYLQGPSSYHWWSQYANGNYSWTLS